jgi:hypothetical protein
MSAKTNGIWDFKSYDEKTWFRDLVCLITVLAMVYVGLHVRLSNESYNYEYNKLSQDQMQLVNRIYLDGQTTDTSKKVKAAAMQASATRIMAYMDNIFDGEIERAQTRQVAAFLSSSNAQEATAYLNGTRFKVHSYFWLVGPAVYWEVVFCALFGVICNLLFVLGAVGSNSTTDLANPETQFDSSEILGQVAKIIYAPICTLALVLGYNFIKGQNIVDIDSSKGLLVFGFIGGYYSSRVISLMDRLKDVILPNSGTAALAPAGAPAMIQQVKISLALDPSVPPNVAAVATGPALNSATVQITMAGTTSTIKGTHVAGDPDGMFTLLSVMTGTYTLTATLPAIPAPPAVPVNLTATLTGPIQSGTTAIPLNLK